MTISGGVGTNVTAITENSTNSALTISTTALRVNSAGTTLANDNAGGTTLLTLSAGTAGEGDLILNNNSAINNGITVSTTAISHTGTVVNSGTGSGSNLISAIIGANVTAVIQSSGTSPLTLSGVNPFTNLTIKAGTVNGLVSASAFGTNAAGGGVITLGDSTGSSDAILSAGFAGPFANAISVAEGNTGVASITNRVAATFSGPVTLNNHDLRLASAPTALTLTLSGGMTGTGNLILNANGLGPITLSTVAINPSGTITNAGSGPIAAAGLATISGGVGSNVTAITENSTNSALTISTTALRVNSAGTTLANNNVGGTALLTLSAGTTGEGDLILNNNSAINNGITVSTLLVNHTGTVVNTGAGPSNTLISAIVGTNVTAMIQNSPSSPLTLTGANPFTNLIIKAGTVIGTTVATAFGTNAAGGGVITLGDTGGSANATLLGGVAGPFSNRISVASGNTGVAAISNSIATAFNGPVTLNDHDLTLTPGTTLLTLGGGITGTGNVTINANAAGGVTLATSAVNPEGTITNSGAGAVATAGTATISAGVGSNVTAVTENSTNSPLTISTTALRVNSAGTTLANNNVGGTALLTLSAGTAGTGDLILNNNSAINNGITVSTLAVSHTGSIVNSGTGSGRTLINVAIGASVTGITQASTTSPLIVTGVIGMTGGVTVNAGLLALGAANTYSGVTEINAGGTLVVSNTTASATALGAVNINSNGTLQGKGGRIYGLVTLNPNGTLSPGNDGSAGGTLTMSNLTWHGGGVFVCEITNVANGAAGAGVDYDRAIVNSNLTAVTNGQMLVIRMDSLGQDLNAGFNPNNNYALKVITCATAAIEAVDVELDTNDFVVGGPWEPRVINNAVYVFHEGSPDKNYWVGAGASTNWSTPGNWSKGHVPWPGEAVVFDGTFPAPCRADQVTNNLGSITLAVDYGSTVTFPAKAVEGGMSLIVSNDITVNSGNLVFAGDTTAVGGGTPTAKHGVGYTLTASNIFIAVGASINSDGLGFALGTGPGSATGWHPTWSSGSHGGQGGAPETTNLTYRLPTYGSAVGPTSLGNGVQVNDSDNNPGGGALKLVVTDTTTVNGRLSADASSQFPSARGAGSGGSVWVASGTLVGSGRISANGTTVTSFAYGHGGGGRIDISGTTNNFTGLIQTSSSVLSRLARGQCGSVVLPPTAGTGATMTNFIRTDLVLGGSLTFSNPVTIPSGVTLWLDANTNQNVFTFDSLTIKSGGVLRCLGNTPEVNTAAGGVALTPYGLGAIIIASNLTIEAGGSLDANAQGFVGGPGSGGTYGGLGTNGVGRTYGSLTNPLALGSGRGTTTSQGGGAIRLIVYDTLTVDGTNACNAATFAGSGGSLWIDCVTLQGNGIISANALPTAGSGGSGGRIHVVYTTNLFTGLIAAYGGGSSVATKGAAGTIILTERTEGGTNDTLIVDNNLAATNLTVTLLPTNTFCFTGTPPTLTLDGVLTRGNGALALPADNTLAVATVFSNGASFVAGSNSTVTLVGTNDASVYGSTTYEDLLISNDAPKTVRFEAGSTNTVNRALSFYQASLLSSTNGASWYLTLVPGTGTQTVSKVSVKDSNASGGQTLIARWRGSFNLGNNVNWLFITGDKGSLFSIY